MKTNTQQRTTQGFWGACARGMILGGLVCVLALAATGGLMLTGTLSQDAAQTACLVSLGIGCLVGSFFCLQRLQQHGLAHGALFGLLFFALLCIIGILGYGSLGAGIWSRLACCVAAGMLGGIWGVNARRRRRS